MRLRTWELVYLELVRRAFEQPIFDPIAEELLLALKRNVYAFLGRFPPGLKVACCARDRLLLVDVLTGKVEADLEHGSPISAVAWSARANRLATGAEDYALRVVRPARLEIERVERCGAAVVALVERFDIEPFSDFSAK